MAANTAPIFTLAGNVSADNSTTTPTAVTTATGDYTGASANHQLVFTAGSNGAFVQRLRCIALGTNIASVLRIYLNNGSTNTTAANNILHGMLSLPATTAIDTASIGELDYSLNFAIPASWRIYVGVGTTVAAGWRVSCIGGNY